MSWQPGVIGNNSPRGQDWLAKEIADLKRLIRRNDSSFGRIAATTTAARPAASALHPGSSVYDTTLSQPIWSDGTNWRDAAGSIV